MFITFNGEADIKKTCLEINLKDGGYNTPAIITMAKARIKDFIYGQLPTNPTMYINELINDHPDACIDAKFMDNVFHVSEMVVCHIKECQAVSNSHLIGSHIDFEIKENDPDAIFVKLTFNLLNRPEHAFGTHNLHTSKSGMVKPNCFGSRPRNMQAMFWEEPGAGQHQEGWGDGWDSIPAQNTRCQDPYNEGESQANHPDLSVRSPKVPNEWDEDHESDQSLYR